MKKALIALAVLGVTSGAAMAQSTVTVYGVADIAIGKAEINNDTKWGVQSNTAVTNGITRLGFVGKEDLGGGMWAGFRFEGQINLANGATENANPTPAKATPAWSREATVSLGSNTWGTVKLGRALTPSYYGFDAWDLTGPSTANYSVVINTFGYGGFPYPRNSAQIDYKTPSFGGLSVELAYIPKADGAVLDGTYAVNNQTDRWDMNVIYANGPLAIAFTANKANKTAPAAGPYASKANYSLGGQYKFGNQFALAASYNRANMAKDSSGGAITRGAVAFGKRYGFSLGGSVFMGPFTITLDLTRDTKNELDALRKKQTNGLLEGRYALSRRTFLYADYLRVDGTNNYSIGIRHNF